MTVEGWETGILGKLCRISIGGTPTRNNPTYWDSGKETENLWVSIRDMNQRVITDTAEYITDTGIKNSNAKTQYQGTVLLSFKLTIGRVAFAGRKLYTNEAIAALETDNLDSTFLYYGLQQWDLLQDVDQAIKGATLNKAKLNKIQFDYPTPIEEQTQIAAILSTIDRAIEQTEAIIAKQQRIKTGLMQDLLTKGIDEDGNVRSESTHAFKDSPLGRIPVEWEAKTCSALCKEIVVGIVIRPAQYYRPAGVPVLRSANVRENIIDHSDLVYMSDKDNISLNKSRLCAGDLVTVRTGYPGTTAVIPPELDGCNCVDIVISRPDFTQVKPNYLALWVNSDFGKKQVLEGQGGLAQQHFNVGEVRKLLVKVPSIAEQQRIENLFLLKSKELLEQQHQLQKLQRQKTGLMQDLLTGNVRVTTLLEAISA